AAAGGPPGLLHHPVALSRILRRQTARNEAISQPGRALQRRRDIAADEELRAALLHRERSYPLYSGNGRLAGPELLHKGQLLLEMAATGLPLGRRDLKVILSPANPQSQGQPAVG